MCKSLVFWRPLPTFTLRLVAQDTMNIDIRKANVHNLRDVDISLPKNQLIVVTGVSGSGKSSLCMDTLFAEGQRRYVESLSSYARQFLNRMDKPDVDSIKGLCPAIAIDQKTSNRSRRATVGSLTEIYDFLRLLFARVGRTISPVSGREVRKHDPGDVADAVLHMGEGARVAITYPWTPGDDPDRAIELLRQKGFTRLYRDGRPVKLDGLDPADLWPEPEVLVDRVVVKADDDELSTRIADSAQTAFFESHGDCLVHDVDNGGTRRFNNRFEADGMAFTEPDPHFFNFNNPIGACPRCDGFGTIIGIDEDLVFPDRSMSVYEGAIACWRGEKMSTWRDKLVRSAIDFDFPVHRAIEDLTDEEYDLLWEGNDHFKGLHAFFRHLESKSYKIQYRVMLSRYRGKTRCTECKGGRLRPETRYVTVHGRHINELLTAPLTEVHAFFQSIELTDYEQQVCKQLMPEIMWRLDMMLDVGLGYLTLNRTADTLSGGEAQRIKLTRSLGSNLTSSLYILDEPSIGLHPRDNVRLLKVLRSLRDLGNTVVVVEHDEDFMRAADHLIDMGPRAGIHGGRVVFEGAPDHIEDGDGLTADYLSDRRSIPVPDQRRPMVNRIHITGARQFDLKNIDVDIPLNALTCVAGVSGSGKTTLIQSILYPALKRHLGLSGDKPGQHTELGGDLDRISAVEMVDQNPLGRSSRSNPVTYVKAYDPIRALYADQQLARVRGFKPKAFSFNVDGGRCDHCKGEGEVVVEMQFLADVHLTCEVCKGRRFKDEVLEVTYRDRSIHEVLEMSVDEALDFFADESAIVSGLQPLQDVGLGYVKLGQSSNTLSGGEAQRVKLAAFLSKGASADPVLFIFDEPTTGLHFHDIQQLLTAFDALIANGHTVLVIEHHPDVLKCADWLVELGPDGGRAGGHLVFQGPPEGILDVDDSPTAVFLRDKLSS